MRVSDGNAYDRQSLDGYQLLANAIVTSAAKDYRSTLRRIKNGSFYARVHLLSLQSFFYSEWYRILTPIKADYIINRLEKEVYHETDMEQR